VHHNWQQAANIAILAFPMHNQKLETAFNDAQHIIARVMPV
jgi:hypothetical protein